jgi:thioesterase domain-containing protein
LGGHALDYAHLVRHLPGTYPVHAIESKGDHTRIETMAEHYLQALMAHQPEGPYHLCGWSFGGTIAFEMACQLQQRGAKMGRLILLDSHLQPGKKAVQNSPAFTAAILTEIAKLLGQNPTDFLALAPDLKQSTNPDTILTALKNQGLAKTTTEQQAIKDIYHTSQAHLQAGNAYQPGHYQGHLTLYRANNQSRHQKPDNGWSSHTQTLQIIDLPATHHTMLQLPHVADLTKQITLPN